MIGSQELILILFAALFLFGPTKLPELAQSLGKAVGEFKKAQIEAEHNLKRLDAPDNREIKIHNLAVEMGITTENKTTEQLVDEIRMKMHSNRDMNMNLAGT